MAQPAATGRAPKTRPPARPVEVQDHLLLAAAASTELQRRTEHRDVTVPGSFADAELWVDPELWAQVRADVNAAMGLLHQAARRPAARGRFASAPRCRSSR